MSVAPTTAGRRSRIPDSWLEAGSFFPVVPSKLGTPPVSSGIVPMAHLVGRLRASASTPVVAVIAPPGYGKTTLLTQWAEADERPFAWVSLDDNDNDPTVLLAYLAAAIHEIQEVDPAVFRALSARQPPRWSHVLSRLGVALSSTGGPFVLVLDDVHMLTAPDAVDVVATLAAQLPQGSQMAVASRGEPLLPLQRSRARGEVLDVGPRDLAIDVEGADSLLREAGASLSEAEVTELTRQTEGWPAALSLAAVAIKAGRYKVRRTGATLGRNRLFVDYMYAELLSGLPAREMEFLTRIAVLDRMDGPLCDWVLDTSGSANRLESLARSSMLMVPLDGHRDRYRFHHLFRDLLREELKRREPGVAPVLSLRAADWCERNDEPDAAIDYAIAAGDADLAARILGENALELYRRGRISSLERWFDWIERHGPIERHPPVALLGAWTMTLGGHPVAAERWADAAERASFEGMLPDGSTSYAAWKAMLRAIMCRHGVEQMRKDAEIAAASLGAGTRWVGTATLLIGLSHLLAGDLEGADDLLADAVAASEETGGVGAVIVGLSERSILAMRREEWDLAGSLAERARAFMRERQMEDYGSSTLVHVAAARVALHRGDVIRGKEDLARAMRTRGILTYALPYNAVQARLELARAHLALTDTDTAKSLLREAKDVLRKRPHLGTLAGEFEELQRQVKTMREDIVGASALTPAELRILPLLATHFSFREIAEELHLSPHTVKSEAISVYRKLGVTSRSGAIQRARDLGLLAG